MQQVVFMQGGKYMEYDTSSGGGDKADQSIEGDMQSQQCSLWTEIEIVQASRETLNQGWTPDKMESLHTVLLFGQVPIIDHKIWKNFLFRWNVSSF